MLPSSRQFMSCVLTLTEPLEINVKTVQKYLYLIILLVRYFEKKKKKKTVQRKREQKGFRGIYKRLPSSASFSFLYTSGTNLPRDSTAHSGLSPPTSITDQDNVPQTGPQVNRSGQFLSRFSLCPGSRLTISKLTSTSVKISCPKAVFIRK